MYDSTGSLLDATGAQTAIVLDDLYAAPAAARTYGVSCPAARPASGCGRPPPSRSRC